MKRAEAKINKVMASAYEEAFKVLETEVKKFMRDDPRFIKYYHMVGWGPSFEMKDGTHIQWSYEMPTKKGKEMLLFCDWFHDTYGAGNEVIEQ